MINVYIIRYNVLYEKGPILMTLEVRVKELAQAKGFRNASELQRKAGLTYPQTARIWQGGNMEMVNLRALAAIAKALGVSAKDLLVETKEEQEHAA